MKNINFGSTFRIPISQPGVNSAKKERLKQFIASYENGLIGSSKTGYARVSISNSEDENFVRKLRQLGYKMFQKFDGENIPKNQIDGFIKEKLDTREYLQIGKNKKPLSREQRQKKRYENSFDNSQTNIDNGVISVEDDIQGLKGKLNSSKSIGVADNIEDNHNKIRNSDSYQKIKNLYGEAFAEAVFFNIREH